MGLARVGAVSLLVVVLRCSQALWAQWVDFDAPSATFGRALYAAATFFGGGPRRVVFEEPDCRILHWDGRAEHFADVLQAAERLIWATACPTRTTLALANAALGVVLEQEMRLPPPPQPTRQVDDILAAERAQLRPLPLSWSALTPWLEDEDGDG